MPRHAIIQRIEDTCIVPIVRAPSTALALSAARAIVASGIDVVEISMTMPDALELLHQLRREVGTEVLLGAGTVLDARTAQACIGAGAEFILAPGFDLGTLRAVHAMDKACIPGALTPTEVIAAWNAGADMVKIFPCSAVGGASYLRALKAPLPQVKMLATGGVDRATAPAFVQAGASALGVGGAVIDVASLAQAGPAAITERCRELMHVVRAARDARREAEARLAQSRSSATSRSSD